MQAMVADAKSVQLDLSNRGIETLEVTEVAGGEIQRLDASRNRLRRFLGSQLQQLKSLQQLDLSHNKLSDVSGLMLLPQLRVLNLARNKLQILEPLQGLTQLEQLDVHSNSISSLEPLSTLTSLSSINAAGNQLQELQDLSALSLLTQLNLRHNHISHLTASDSRLCRTSPTTAAGATNGHAAHACCAAEGRSSSSNNRQYAGSKAILPCSLRRLSVACNQLQDVSTLTALQQLPSLLDLCVDGNPFTAADRQPHSAAAAGGGSGTRCASSSSSSSNSSSTCWYRGAVLAAACTPSLLMLDGRPVSPAERSLLLHSAAKLSAISKGQQLQELDSALTSHAYSRPLQGAGQGDPAGQGASGSVAAGIEAGVASVTAATQQNRQEEGPPEEQQHVCMEQQQQQSQFDSLTSSMRDLQLQTGSEQPWQHLHVQQQQQQGHQDLADAATATQPSTPQPLQQRQQQLPLQYQGSLREAAMACGIDVDEGGAVDATRQPAKQPLGTSRSPQLPAGEAAALAAAIRAFRSSPTAAGAGVCAGVNGGNDDDVFGVFMDDAEVEEYLQVEKARLLTRRRASPPPPIPPPETPGMELHGSRCVLTGSVLHLLKAEAVAAVSDLTLAHVAYAEVLDAFTMLMGLKRLRSLSLVNNKGLATLPQLHPLLQLRKLSHLMLKDSPICSLVLLQPYVAFRFSSLQSFNGQTLTAEDRSAAGVVFGGLEAALDAALDEAPQQAALAAAGIQVSARPMHHPHTTPTSGGEAGCGQQQPGSLNPAGVEPSTGGTSAPMASSSGATAAGVTASKTSLDALHTGSAPSTAAITSTSSSGRVTQVFAAMRGPLLPPPAVMEQGRQFAQQLLREAAVVQQQLAEFEEVTWPALVEESIHEAWSGHPSGAAPEW